VVDIDADLNRNGIVENYACDENPEEPVGMIVIANKDDVYEDEDEPARRRELVVRSSDDEDVYVRRSSNRLRLFLNPEPCAGEVDIFESNPVGPNLVKLDTNRSYWVQGGESPSPNVRGDWLAAYDKESDPEPADKINFTVLWVEISGVGYPGSFEEAPLYDGHSNQILANGHANLGVHPCTESSHSCLWFEDGEWHIANAVAGSVQIVGTVSPSDFSRNAFDVPITHDFSNVPDASGEPGTAYAAFGFCFRRFVTTGRVYWDGMAVPVVAKEHDPDDSLRAYQDVDPDYDPTGGRMVIIDGDAPRARYHRESSERPSFIHCRYSFTEHIVFNFEAYDKPERCSEKYKWACTMDAGVNTVLDTVFIREQPNTGGNINEVILGEHLEDRGIDVNKVGLSSAPHLESADGEKKIVKGPRSTVSINGANLIGVGVLEKTQGTEHKLSGAVYVVETATGFSACTRAYLFFDTQAFDPGANWQIRMFNEKGHSNAITGFELVDEDEPE